MKNCIYFAKSNRFFLVAFCVCQRSICFISFVSIFFHHFSFLPFLSSSFVFSYRCFCALGDTISISRKIFGFWLRFVSISPSSKTFIVSSVVRVWARKREKDKWQFVWTVIGQQFLSISTWMSSPANCSLLSCICCALSISRKTIFLVAMISLSFSTLLVISYCLDINRFGHTHSFQLESETLMFDDDRSIECQTMENMKIIVQTDRIRFRI